MSWLSEILGGDKKARKQAKKQAAKDREAEAAAIAREQEALQRSQAHTASLQQQASSEARARDAQHRTDLAALEKRHSESQKSQQSAYDAAAKQAQQQFADLIAAFETPEAPEPRAAPLQPDAGAAQVKAVRSTRRKDRRKKSGVAGLILSSLAGGSGQLGA